jgi:putative membrane-bound dehydrogenase-like protein
MKMQWRTWLASILGLVLLAVAPRQSIARAGDDEFPGPVTAADAVKTISVRPGMKVELVASEPLVADPVNIAWGADGRLWVVEMADYPNGIDGSDVEGGGKPGGRVKFLVDDDGDGRYDRATLFADELNFPTGITPFRDGVLVTAAPHLLFLVDTDGDGRADKREVLLEGFGEGNQQHRVNGLAWGLDNWLYLANGDSDGKIRSTRTGQIVDIQGRDLRYNPWTGEIDAETGRAQYGRCRDDAGNWFGCNNSNPCWHYVLSDRYVRRNPYYAPPKLTHPVPEVPGAAPVYPTSRTLTRFNDFDKANRFTSACGLTIYRDNFLGEGFRGNSFVCEPVHNLVHREIMEPDGVTFRSRRAPDEQTSEFFASSDSWCRPVAAHTGPDGALYIVDMYRLVIEHPKWIPEEWQKKLDLRAGHDKGRIYRVFPTGTKPRAIPKLDKLDTKQLVAALDSPNGWQRDTAQRLLVERKSPDAQSVIETSIGGRIERPAVQNEGVILLHCLAALAGMDSKLAANVAEGLVFHQDPRLRRNAWIFCEPRIAHYTVSETKTLPEVWRKEADDGVRMQMACSLGECNDAQMGAVLAHLQLLHPQDDFFRAAVFSSFNTKNIGAAFDVLLHDGKPTAGGEQLFPQLLGLAATMPDASVTERLVDLFSDDREPIAAWRMTALAEVLDAQARRRLPSAAAAMVPSPIIDRLGDHARTLVLNDKADVAERAIAVRLLGRQSQHKAADLQTLGKLLGPTNPPEMQDAAVAAWAKLGDDATPSLLLARWSQAGPRLRGQLLDLLLARTPWTAELLKAVESGSVKAAHFDAARRQRLLTYKDKSLRAEAERLLGAGGESDRKQLVEQYTDVLKLPGEAGRGRETFRKKCAVCHKLEGHGNEVGPDLVGLKDKSPTALLTAMLDPNRAVEDKFVGYLVVTVDGLTHVGMIGEESGTAITLRLADGKTATVLRTDIEELQSTGKSHMPEGLEKDLAKQDFADLIEYVRNVGR